MTKPGGPYVGIDLGGTKIEGVVLDADLQPRLRTRIPPERDKGYRHILERVRDLVASLRAEAPGVDRVGIGTPGSLSLRDGRLKNANTTCMNGERVRDDLEQALGCAVRVENDADCFALAEARLGAARDARVVFGVILGTGCGGGIVVDGELWRGHQRIAGEWGHTRIDPAGPTCWCGQRGCVEALCAGPALERQYVDARGAPCAAVEIGARARDGEAVARTVLARWVDVLGGALANVVNVLDPDAVVLGGGLSNLDVLYDGAFRDAVARRVFNDELRTPIVRNALGDSAGVIGAALLTVA
jgi:fructokinase